MVPSYFCSTLHACFVFQKSSKKGYKIFSYETLPACIILIATPWCHCYPKLLKLTNLLQGLFAKSFVSYLPTGSFLFLLFFLIISKNSLANSKSKRNTYTKCYVLALQKMLLSFTHKENILRALICSAFLWLQFKVSISASGFFLLRGAQSLIFSSTVAYH